MNYIFLVLGYGVPRDIMKDENYNFYLRMIFNKIYSLVVKNGIIKPIIIFSGGETDCYRPYNRNEADEMIRLFKVMTKRPFVRKATRDWLFISEKKSLSTLENFLNCKKIITNRKVKKANIRIFCEQTRERRIKILAKRIFVKNCDLDINPIDFDFSLNRYLDLKFIARKEQEELKHCLWALQSQKNLKKHHKLFEEKLKYFRKFNPNKHPETIKEYWEKKLEELKNKRLYA